MHNFVLCQESPVLVTLGIVQNFSSYEYGDCTMIGTSDTSRSPYYEKFCTAKVTILWLYIVQNVQVTSMVTVLCRHQSHIMVTILWQILYCQGHHTVTLHSTKWCKLRVCVTGAYIGTSHTYTITILWKILYCQGHHTVTLHSTKCFKLRVWWLYYIGTSHTSRSPYYEKFCTAKVTILWLYIVQNVQVTSMVTVLYRHQSHITITILWKILYCQGHHTVLHSTKWCKLRVCVTGAYIGTSHTSRSPYYAQFCTMPRVTVWWPWQYKIFHSLVIVMCDWCLYSTVTILVTCTFCTM